MSDWDNYGTRMGAEAGPAVDRELGWDDAIENEGPQYVLLPEGEYEFTVVKWERGRFPGSDKLPPCPKATVTVNIKTPEGETNIDHQLFLHTKTEGLLCSFFTSIGQRKHGERITMNWNAVTGTKGRCKVTINTYEKDGQKRQNNRISKFLEPAAGTTFEQGKF